MANILVVDDSKLAREKLKIYIKELGHSVIGEAQNGNEGFEKYKQLNQHNIF